MPHVSRHKLSPKIEAELYEKLTSVLTAINKQSDTELFLSALLTNTEKVMLAKRLAIIVLVEEGLTDSEIAQTLHITRITIAKMRYFYEARGEGYKIAIRELEKQKKLQDFKKLLLSIARYSVRAAGGRVKPTILD